MLLFLLLAVILTSLKFYRLTCSYSSCPYLCVLAAANVVTFLCTAAELTDLVRELQEVNNWITFGLYLGIEMSRLEAIKVDCPTLEDRRTQMLSEWQKKVTPTWSAVVQALDKMGMRRLASELAQKHGWLRNVKMYIFYLFC